MCVWVGVTESTDGEVQRETTTERQRGRERERESLQKLLSLSPLLVPWHTVLRIVGLCNGYSLRVAPISDGTRTQDVL